MAETFSTEYTNLVITKPTVKTQRIAISPKAFPFDYTQVLAGTAADTCVLARLPAFSQLDLILSWISGEGFTSGMTLSLGWKAYTDSSGVVQAASATGLFNASDVSNTTFVLNGGMQATATPDDEIPVIAARLKDFQNVTPVDLFVTFGAQAPGANARLRGVFYYLNIG